MENIPKYIAGMYLQTVKIYFGRTSSPPPPPPLLHPSPTRQGKPNTLKALLLSNQSFRATPARNYILSKLMVAAMLKNIPGRAKIAFIQSNGVVKSVTRDLIHKHKSVTFRAVLIRP